MLGFLHNTFEIGPLPTATTVLGHQYADDVHAYLHNLVSSTTAAIWAMSQAWAQAFEAWMSMNHQRLNLSKTKYLSGLALDRSFQS